MTLQASFAGLEKSASDTHLNKSSSIRSCHPTTMQASTSMPVNLANFAKHESMPSSVKKDFQSKIADYFQRMTTRTGSTSSAPPLRNHTFDTMGKLQTPWIEPEGSQHLHNALTKEAFPKQTSVEGMSTPTKNKFTEKFFKGMFDGNPMSTSSQASHDSLASIASGLKSRSNDVFGSHPCNTPIGAELLETSELDADGQSHRSGFGGYFSFLTNSMHSSRRSSTCGSIRTIKDFPGSTISGGSVTSQSSENANDFGTHSNITTTTEQSKPSSIDDGLKRSNRRPCFSKISAKELGTSVKLLDKDCMSRATSAPLDPPLGSPRSVKSSDTSFGYASGSRKTPFHGYEHEKKSSHHLKRAMLMDDRQPLIPIRSGEVESFLKIPYKSPLQSFASNNGQAPNQMTLRGSQHQNLNAASNDWNGWVVDLPYPREAIE